MTQEKRENFMFTKDTIFYKKLLGLMLPMMLQNLMLALVAVADAFMLGGMDQNYMSAVSLATQIQFIQTLKKRNADARFSDDHLGLLLDTGNNVRHIRWCFHVSDAQQYDEQHDHNQWNQYCR